MREIAVVAALAIVGAFGLAHAQSGVVSAPNATYGERVNDLVVQTAAGEISWQRTYNGKGWRFNRHWDGISATYKPMAAQSLGGGAGAALSAYGTASSGEAGCWVWVDEDWDPSQEGAKLAEPLLSKSYSTFNQMYSQTAQSLAVFGVASCAYQGAPAEFAEGFRRGSSLYVGSKGTYIFKNRYTLKKQSVPKLPTTQTPAGGAPVTGSVDLGQATPVDGWRWQDRAGDWAEYDDNGQLSRYGDKNDNVVWIQRDARGWIERVIDGGNLATTTVGQTALTLHYNADGFLLQVRDYPQAGNALDLPQRTVSYTYNLNGQLASVTDVRGNVTTYGYDGLNRAVTITDPEGRITRFAYEGESTSVAKLTAADGSVSDFTSSYDDVKKAFYTKLQGPLTASGRRVEDYTHDRSGDLLKYEQNGRTDIEIKRDPAARTETRTNARGFATVYTKNEYEQVIAVQNPDGTRTSTTYDALFLNPVEITDEAGFKTKNEYDAKGNLIRRTQALGTPEQRVTEYAVDAAGHITRLTRKGRTEANGTVTPDAVWQVSYDAAGQISQTTDPEGSVRQYVYDRGGNLVSYIDPRSNATRYEVDPAGNLKKITDPLGHLRSLEYDKVGNEIAYVDARLKRVQATYDAMNRRTVVTNPVGGNYTVVYNAQGLIVGGSDEDGRTAQAEFDNFLRITKNLDALGNVTLSSYQVSDGTQTGTLGSLGDPTEIKYPTFTEQTKFDERGRPTSRTLLNPNALGTEGLVNTIAYEARGLMKSQTDANGKTRFLTYDGLRQLVEATDSLGNKTQAQYDARGNLLQIKDAKGNVNRFEYDRNNRLVTEILPLGQTTRYTYDAAGNAVERVDPNGHRSVIAWDADSRLSEVKEYRSPNNALVRTTTYTWDEEDNLVAWSDTDYTRPGGQQTSSSVAVFDDAGRKTSETVTYPTPAGDTLSLSYGYAYSPGDYKTQLTWPDGTMIGYGYSLHGQLESVTIPGEGTISVGEFKWFAPAKVTLPGGSVQDRSYDGLLSLESFKVRNPGQQLALTLQNTYGKVQELKTSERTDTAGTVSTTQNRSFGYDDETRLTQATTGGLVGTDIETFTLDAVGNRVAHSRVAGAWTYDANNRLLQRGTGSNATSYEYDEAGNLTKKTEGATGSITRYAYDTRNRLVEVRDGSDNLVARYGYDISDHRIWKEQYRDGVGQALAPAKRSYYLYSDESLIAESRQDITLNVDGTVSAAAGPVIVTQYGPSPDSEFTTGVLFVKTKNTQGQDVFAYYHNDQLDTPVQATDKAGNIVWAANYDAFGRAAITTPTATTDKPTIESQLRLPGQIEDPETGLYYNFRRYYDPSIGRYVTQDPIGVDGGFNLYRYAEADPINKRDPTGEILPYVIAFATCMASCMLQDAAINLITGECNNFGDSAKNCAIGCAIGLGVGALFSKLGRACNSFDSDTLVHVRPKGAENQDAAGAKSVLKPINRIEVGDEVLAYSEWKDKGSVPARDQRLSYEKVTDVFTSFQAQNLVHLTLDDGQTLTATEGHPFKTIDGWRDAVLLKKGGKLLLKSGETQSDSERAAEITDIRIERKALPVFNLEVANAHTYFVGADGELVHNGRCTPKMRKGWEKLHGRDWPKNPPTERIRPGGNQDGHHIVPVARGGHPTDPRNITPMTPSDHMDWHRRNGYR
jgi:RHS repeat-associated protein